jgi:hypothetical protein
VPIGVGHARARRACTCETELTSRRIRGPIWFKVGAVKAGGISLQALVAGALLVGALVLAGSSGAAAKPSITSVALAGSQAKPLFIIRGKNFGRLPGSGQAPSTSSACRADKAPGNQGINFGNKLYFVDLSNKFSAGLSGPYKGTADVVDCVGVIIKSFSSSKVEYALGSDYTKHPYSVKSGDSITFAVSGATATVRVRYGSTVSSP